jgi:hypothetical protein
MAPLLLLALLVTRTDDAPSPWLSDLEEAKRVALKKSKPIFIVFRCEH